MTVTRLRELAGRYGVEPSKAMGQNFVVDPNTLRRIVRIAEVTSADRVLEVGAGFGSLTLELARTAARVVAVEFDRKLSGPLAEVLDAVENVELVWADALATDLARIIPGGGWKMVSNLPYNIATPLLARLLEDSPSVDDLTLMVQKEVGERWVAGPGSRTYGAISVLVAYHCDARIAATVPPTVFWPKPKVSSVIVRMRRRPSALEVSGQDLMRVVRWSFGHRRKTMRNALATGSGKPVAEVERALVDAGLDPSVRAEQLGLTEFARLTRSLGA